MVMQCQKNVLKSNLLQYIPDITLHVYAAKKFVFSSVLRPPYQPKYGSIEYKKICDLIGAVSKMARPHWTTADLEHAIRTELFRSLAPFDSTFDHCGYTVDGVYQPRTY